jgi:hypothetical protein
MLFFGNILTGIIGFFRENGISSAPLHRRQGGDSPEPNFDSLKIKAKAAIN